MDSYQQILEAIYEGIREVNSADPEQRLEESPDTLLTGGPTALSSLSLVTLASVAEEAIDRAFDKSISLIDILVTVESDSFDVAALARRIAERIGAAVPD